MRSLLTVTTETADLALLTMEELRAATDIKSGRDAELTALGKAVAAAITSHCNVRADGAVPPTLRRESLSETFRLVGTCEGLRLARRPVAAIVSVTEDDVALDACDYELDAALGMLRRLEGDYPAAWCAAKLVVAYSAGWDTVPDNLRMAAKKLATVLWSEGGQPSNLKRVEIPGLGTREYWVGPTDDPLIPAEIADLLGDYINPAMA